jgi:glycosyltransferase involved in cell wall biosynthesis
LPEPTYAVSVEEERADADRHFSYVDPRNRDYQLEMERIATAHLKRIEAYIDPPNLPLSAEQGPFPVEASVVIPVRNRCRTVADAVESALSQETDFAFNVIVVDNYSSDGTTEILSGIAQHDSRLIHVTPHRTDLGIGGCWNAAIHADACGRLAVQLDSDDLYAQSDVLQRIVAEFQRTGCAMVIGSYTIVDFDLTPIPPGLVDHREWTHENGHNNALRIAGMGAPRAFHVPTLRDIEFPNVSYGEDYAVALKITGRHRISRIYDSLYWCRRWEDNTDHALPLKTINRYAVYKDRLRSIEIAARQNRKT